MWPVQTGALDGIGAGIAVAGGPLQLPTALARSRTSPAR